VTVFFVSDNGIGIEPQYHERVFGLFNKLDGHGEGTGIGLALVKRIIEVRGGRVWIESSGPGAGTTFCFTLAIRYQFSRRRQNYETPSRSQELCKEIKYEWRARLGDARGR